MCGGPGLLARQSAMKDRKRDQRRAGQRRDSVQRAEPPKIVRVARVARDGSGRSFERAFWLRNEGQFLGAYKTRAKRLTRPIEQRVPRCRLQGNQSLRT